MNQKRFVSFFMMAAVAGLVACNSGSDNKTAGTENNTQTSTGDNAASNSGVDESKGIGKFQNVQLTHPLDEKMVAAGKNVYEVKCASCHKLTDERVMGPGWKGITDRRTPEFIMNFITNVDENIDKTKAGQEMLEQCLVRMPNQNLSDDDARAILEFMRKNDGKN